MSTTTPDVICIRFRVTLAGPVFFAKVGDTEYATGSWPETAKWLREEFPQATILPPKEMPTER